MDMLVGASHYRIRPIYYCLFDVHGRKEKQQQTKFFTKAIISIPPL